MKRDGFKFWFVGVFLCSFSARVGRKRTKRTPHKGKRVSFRKKRTCRIFLNFNILSALMDPPRLRALPVARVSLSAKGNFISRPLNCSRDLFWDKAEKLVLRYVLGSILLNYWYDSEGIFSLAKKASHPINCAYIGEAFWLHLDVFEENSQQQIACNLRRFSRKRWNASPRILPDKS